MPAAIRLRAEESYMGIKETIIKGLSRATSDKTELNQTILKYKKKFDEASAALGYTRKKKEK